MASAGSAAMSFVRVCIATTSNSWRSTTSPTPRRWRTFLKYDSVLGPLAGDGHRTTPTRSPSAARRIKVFATKDPAELDWTSVGAEIVDRIHRPLHRCQGRRQAPARHGEEGHHLRSGEERRRHPGAGRQQRRLRPRQAQHHLQRVLHHELPGAGGEGAARDLRHPEGLDDHDPQLHQRSERSSISRTRTCAAPAPPRST